MPKDGHWRLCEWPADVRMQIKCARCGRHGKYKRDTLIQGFGREYPLKDIALCLASDSCRRTRKRQCEVELLWPQNLSLQRKW